MGASLQGDLSTYLSWRPNDEYSIRVYLKLHIAFIWKRKNPSTKHQGIIDDQRPVSYQIFWWNDKGFSLSRTRI